ncbi:MAG: signal peptide peptidase SppA [Planctomycetes bacterium]|nr:signal peptide peptidase SppA [Planctomycetota bacterium]
MAHDDVPLTPIAPRQAAPAPQIILQQPPSAFGRFGKWLLAALGLAILFIIGLYSSYHSYFAPTNAPVEKYHSLSRTALNKIAIIDVSGAIMEGEDSFAKKQIDRVREDTSVVGVVVRINSPGGTVTGSDYLYHHLRELKEERGKEQPFPVVVSMGSVCASGGYYVAMSVGDEKTSIFAEPTTWTGSIGVIIPHYDLSGTLKAIGVADDSIASGPLKQMGSPTKPMTDEERKVLQTLVDESFKGFKEIVASGRPQFKSDAAALDAAATGQIFTAKQALERGLVDKIGFVEDAISRVAELLGQDTDDLRCVKYEEPPTLISSLVGAEAPLKPSGRVDLGALIDLTTPRAYYLWSWLPAAMSNTR